MPTPDNAKDLIDWLRTKIKATDVTLDKYLIGQRRDDLDPAQKGLLQLPASMSGFLARWFCPEIDDISTFDYVVDSKARNTPLPVIIRERIWKLMKFTCGAPGGPNGMQPRSTSEPIGKLILASKELGDMNEVPTQEKLRIVRELLGHLDNLEASVLERAADAEEPPAVDNLSGAFWASDDYRCINLRGVPYSLSEREAGVMKMLIEAHFRGIPDVSKDRILTEVCGVDHSPKMRVRDIFNDRKVYIALVARGEREGLVRFNYND